MNAVGFLAIFAVVFIQDASTLVCKKTDTYNDANAISLTEETCTSGVTKCRRPVWDASTNNFVTNQEWGCGDQCAQADSTKCIVCGDNNCNTLPVKCKIGPDVTAASNAAGTFCADIAKSGDTVMIAQQCLRPKKNYITWTSATSFECGASCTGKADCVACDGPDNCNDPASVDNKTPADHKCFGYTWANSAWTKAAATQCKGYDDSAARCNMPKATANSNNYIYNGGCGACPIGTTNKCSTCNTASCNDIRECYTNEANTATALCFGETKCKRPVKSYGGYAKSGTWGCGACASNSKDCKECTGDKCNAKVVSKTSKCYTYKWDTDKFVKGDSAVCDRGENAAIACNMPTMDAKKKEDYTTLTGCGPCKTGEKCKVCAEEECSSAPVKTATALLFALLYIMI